MPSKKTKKPTSTYGAHRERQRRRILDAAWKLFIEHGIDSVTMAQITAGSGVQPSTMYQYFSSKDDIVWANLGELIVERSEFLKQKIASATNAFARITLMLESMADELSNNRDKVRFMAQFDAIYAHTWPAERLLALESQITPEPFQVFSLLIREGIKDGSLRSDLDPDLTMHAVMNAAIGAQRRLASLGDKIELEYGQSIHQLLRETIRILLLGLRAAPQILPRTRSRKQIAAKRQPRKR